MNEPEANSRATKIFNSTEEEQTLQKAVKQIQSTKKKSVFNVLSKYIETPPIKFEPEFINDLFKNNLSVVSEMIDWMLIPKHLIKVKKIRSNVEGYSYNCKQFMKDNWCFYEEIYLHARNGKLPFDVWFKFLTKQYYDPETIQTALGYFSEVMIPFAKYQFSEASYLIKQLEQSQLLFTTNLTIGILQLLKQNLLNKIIQYSHHTAIFQFLTTAILLNIENPKHSQIAEQALLKLLKNSQKQITFPLCSEDQQNFYSTLEILQSISTFMKETVNNINQGNSLTYRIQVCIRTILNSEIINYAIEALTESRMCNFGEEKKFFASEMLFKRKSEKTGVNFSDQKDQKEVKMDMNLSQPYQSLQKHNNENNLHQQHTKIVDTDNQQEYLQILLRILTYSVDIFIKIPKYIKYSQTSQKSIKNIFGENLKESVIKIELSEENSSSIDQANVGKKSDQQKNVQNFLSPGRNRRVQYQRLVSIFCRQMQDLLDSLPKINFLVYRPTGFSPMINSQKTITFSSGQNIKPITLVKHQYFILIYACLAMIHIRNIESSDGPSSIANTINQNNSKSELGLYSQSSDIKSRQLPSINSCDQKMKKHHSMDNGSESFNVQIPQILQQQSQDGLDSEECQSWDQAEEIVNEGKGQDQQKIKNEEVPLRKSKKKKSKRIQQIMMEPLTLDLQKIYLIEVIQKYLTENRWNNIAHKTLQKIFHLLVMRDYEYLGKKIKRDQNKKMSDSLISFLIENFTQKDYIFLESFKFTSQGNLHSIYNISKDLAYTLNSTNQLVLILNEFKPWKKFIIHDLRNYEEKAYPHITMPQFWDLDNQNNEMRKSYGLKVDEVDTIKKLIQNISFTKQWPSTKSKKLKSKSGIVFRNSGGQLRDNQKSDYMIRSFGSQFSNRLTVSKIELKTVDNLLKKRIEFSKDGSICSEIDEFSVQDISIRNKISNPPQKLAKSQTLFENGQFGEIKNEQANKSADDTAKSNNIVLKLNQTTSTIY